LIYELEFYTLKMLEKFFTREILFVFFLAHVSTSPLSSGSAISVTVGIMDRYHATCVLLLYPHLQQGMGQDCDLYWFYVHALWTVLFL